MASIFRKKSLDRVSSPEQLDGYIQVSNPGVWMILGAIALLLVGVLVWACVGTITETAPAALVVRDGEATCYVAQDRASEVAQGDEVVAADAHGTITVLSGVPAAAQDVLALTGDVGSDALGGAAWAQEADVSISLPDGVYGASVVTASYRPLALLFGGM